MPPSGYATEPNDCISIIRERNSIGHFMKNNCNVKLYVSWFDEGNCHNKCGVIIRAYGEQVISKTKGRVRWAACVYPKFPSSSGNGYGRYSCN